MIRQNKILIPLGNIDRGLKSLHYALALAERLEVKIYIVQLSQSASAGASETGSIEVTVADLVNSARQAGISISHHVADNDLENEIVSFVKKEGIDVLVFSEDDARCADLLRGIKPRVSLPIIQVTEKDHVDYL